MDNIALRISAIEEPVTGRARAMPILRGDMVLAHKRHDQLEERLALTR